MKVAPVILFVYNRPEHTSRVLRALEKNELAGHTEVFILSDGPKESADAETIAQIKRVREIISGKFIFKNTVVIESKINKGLALSVTEGVSQIIDTYEKVIVLEDDHLTSPHFLQFMNDGLRVYEKDNNVACITGYTYPVKGKLPQTFFLKGADCWGWATWNRAWNIFEKDGRRLLNQLEYKSLTKEFDFDNSYPYTQMLRDQIVGENNSWAILWYASAFLREMYCLYPGISLVKNIGMDGTGVHSENSGKWDVELAKNRISVEQITVSVNKSAREKFIEYFRSNEGDKKTFFSKGMRKIKSLVPHSLKIKYRAVFRQPVKSGWFGNYSDWSEATENCTGYDQSNILDKVKAAVLKVKHGEAVYERDSVVFDKSEYSKIILNTLQKIADENKRKLNIVDFGGSLGSTYFQYRNLLKNIQKLDWRVIEQPHFVDAGRAEIEDENLKFYYNIDDALVNFNPQLLILSSVVQYFEKPYQLINELLKYKFEYILIDRTSFIDSEKERITIQIVPENIYKASYPAWFLNKNKFIKAFIGYDLCEEFESEVSLPVQLEKNVTANWKGFILKRIK